MESFINRTLKTLNALGASLEFAEGNVVSVGFDEVKRKPTVNELLGLQYLKELRAIDFHGLHVDSEVLKAIADLPALESLNLNCSTVDNSAIQAVSRIKTLCRLELMDTAVTDASLPILEGLGRLVSLRIDGTRITSAGMKTILRHPLETLWLDGHQASDDDMAILSCSTDLRYLSLVGEAITDDTVAPLGRSRSLRGVSLLRTSVTEAGLRALVDIPFLEELFLNGSTGIRDDAFEALKKMNNLKKLWLPQTGITAEGLAHFARNVSNINIWPTTAWLQAQHG